jgi:surface protein
LGNERNGYFFGCANLTIPATDVLDLTETTTLESMFSGCASLTTIPSIGSWNTSLITSIYGTFFGATSLNIDIRNWNVESVTTAQYMFWTAANLSTANYDALLISWAGQAVQPNVAFHANTSTFTSGGAAEAAKAVLVGAPNLWTITDGGGI